MNFSLITEQWIETGIAVLVFLVTVAWGRRILAFFVQGVLRRWTGLRKPALKHRIFEAIAPPLYWLAVVYTFRQALARTASVLEPLNFEAEPLFFVLYVSIGGVMTWRLITAVAKWYERRLTSDRNFDPGRQLMPLLRRVALILVTLIATIILLDRFNVEVSGLVATLGIGSLAIALASQAALADTVSGFVIMLDRPYRIGDRIEIQELGTWGDVEDIGLRSTRIQTRDNRMIIVPNSVMGKSLIVNHSYPDSQYRIENNVGVAYGTDIEKARAVIVAAVRKVEGVLTDQPVEALFLEFGESALVFRIRWWLDSYTDTRRMFDRVNTAIYKALKDASIEIPFPQRVLTHKGSSAVQVLSN